MGYSKRRGSSTSKVLPKEFLRMKEQYLIDIKLEVKFEDIPEQLIINRDQTAVKLVPSASLDDGKGWVKTSRNFSSR